MMQLNTTPDSQLGAAIPSAEFMFVPVNQIVVSDQIRSTIDTNTESFQALKNSIASEGVQVPILLARLGGELHLIAGERRYRACLMLGITEIPARILPNVSERDKIIAIQLVENLQRENLDPIDEANAFFKYAISRHGGLDLDTFITIIVNHQRDPVRLSTEDSGMLAALGAISGKSLSTLRRSLLLLKLPDTIKEAVRTGKIAVSQGYILGENLDNPALAEIFQSLIEKPLTNDALTKKLAAAKKAAEGKRIRVTKIPFSRYRRSLNGMKHGLELTKQAFDAAAAELFLKDLRDLMAVVESLKARTLTETAVAAEPVEMTTPTPSAYGPTDTEEESAATWEDDDET